MNTNLKPTLWAIFAALVMMIWLKWGAANAPQPLASEVVQTSATTATSNDPTVPGNMQPAIPGDSTSDSTISQSPQNSARLIHVKTDVLDVTIDTVGGSIVESQLLDYTVSVKDASPMQLFSSTKGKIFLFRTGLWLYDNPNAKKSTNSVNFSSPHTHYTLDGESLSVPLSWQADGITVSKTFTFHRGRYDFEVAQRVDNQSNRIWHAYEYAQLERDEPQSKGGLTSFASSSNGGVYSTQDVGYEKLDYAKLAAKGIDLKNVKGGWIGMMQHYFMGAIIPSQTSVNTFESNQLQSGRYTFGLYSETQSIPADSSTSFNIIGFVGPKIKDDLARIAPNLDKATDYGKLFFISEFLFDVLNWVHSIVKNWGWAIVIVTLGIKTLLFPLAAKSFKSMAKMRKFQPEMERIRENYKEDRQLQGKKMMELYKKEGINPASGCLPILVQIPIFLAFYYMLMESVELRQAPWIFWIKDLSVQDPFFVLPVLNMGLMFIQQRLNPPPSDPLQRKVMMFLPLIFGFMFLVFPAGLVLYWAVSNLFSIIQQYVITKRYGGLANPLSHADDKHYHPKE